MPLYHNDDQVMLKDSVAPFIADNAPVAHLRKLRDTRDETGFSRELWASFTEMGLPGILVPEAHGGLGMGHAEAGIVLEEIGRNLTPSPFLSTSVGAVAALAKADRLDETPEVLAQSPERIAPRAETEDLAASRNDSARTRPV